MTDQEKIKAYEEAVEEIRKFRTVLFLTGELDERHFVDLESILAKLDERLKGV